MYGSLHFATYAVLECDIDNWSELKKFVAELVHFARPRDLDPPIVERSLPREMDPGAFFVFQIAGNRTPEAVRTFLEDRSTARGRVEHFLGRLVSCIGDDGFPIVLAVVDKAGECSRLGKGADRSLRDLW